MQPATSDLDTDRQPPLALPFAHFVTGALLLLVGGAIAGIGPLFLPISSGSVATLHLLLAGWLGLTIMGAMVQFVPVWSGTHLHSERLSRLSLWLVLLGVSGVVGVFLTRAYAWFPAVAGVLLLGFWTFAYTIVRTLPPIEGLDVTEAHFLVALAALVIATLFGWVLATDLSYRILDGLPVTPRGLLMAHLTLTVFGFVAVTIVGALYQLGPMFTQAPASAVDTHLAHVEMISLPSGVFLLAAGRLVEALQVARVGAVLLLAGLFAFALVHLRRLWAAQVDSSPLLRRYWIVGLSLVGWTVLTLPGWLLDPLAHALRFGSQNGTHLLFVGVFTVTVVGTFYHVVPFVVWFHEYSDRLGYEPVPMIDDLYDSRIATVECWLLAGGLLVLWGGELLGLPSWVLLVGGNLLGAGVLLFAANMGLVVWRHRPATLREVLRLMAFKRSPTE